MDLIDDPELGSLRYCGGCDEWWPADEEFWSEGSAVCRACWYERRRHRRLVYFSDEERRAARLATMRESARRYRARTAVT